MHMSIMSNMCNPFVKLLLTSVLSLFVLCLNPPAAQKNNAENSHNHGQCHIYFDDFQ